MAVGKIKKEDKRFVINPDKDLVWGTHVVGTEAYAGDPTPPTENDISIDDSDALGGEGLPTCVIPVRLQGGEATITSKAYFNQLAPYWFGAFGGYDHATVTAGVEQHRFAMLAASSMELEKWVHSFALEEGLQVRKWNGILSESALTIDNGVFMVESTWMCDYNSVSVANLDPSTLLGNCDVMKFPRTTVWLNAADGADFVNGDKINVTDLQLTAMRGLATQDAENGETYPSQPLETETGRPQLMVMLKFKTKNVAVAAADYRAAFVAKSDYKMKIEVIGNVLDSPHTNKFTLYIPRLTFQTGEAPVYDVASPTAVTLNMMTLKAAVAPTGMIWVLPYGDLINDHATYDYDLAAGSEDWAI